MQEEKLSQVREREQLSRSSFLSLGFTAAISAHSVSKEVVGFLLYFFPKENICVYCLLCLNFVLVILSVKDPKIMLA